MPLSGRARKVLSDAWFAGIDGCRAGWLLALMRAGDGEVRLRSSPHPRCLRSSQSIYRSGCPNRRAMVGGGPTIWYARCSVHVNRRCFQSPHAAQSLQKLALSAINNRDLQPISVHARSPGKLQIRRGASAFLLSAFFPRFARWTRSYRAIARSTAGCTKHIPSLHFGASMERARWHHRKRLKRVSRCVAGC
jgi:hypothetical protein